MNRRTSVDPLQHEHDEFERQLLGSAADDAPSAEQAERAWLKFAAGAGALAAGASALSAAGPRAPVPGAASAGHRTPRAQALKWAAMGALSGGGLVALWLAPHPPVPPPLPARVVQAPATPEIPAPPSLAPSEPPRAILPPPSQPVPSSSARPLARGSATRAAQPAQRAPTGAPPAAHESLLAREVAALDAARTALAIGAGASALQQIEHYHRDFPAGELGADADAIAIEALALGSDDAALQRAAHEFLERHPRDPHAARVRELSARGAAAP